LEKASDEIMKQISINNLSYKYPECNKFVLKDISMDIEAGQTILLLGNSGSGKSTLAKCLTRTVPNFYGGTVGGHVFIDGKDINEISHKEMAKIITMVFQDPERQLVMDKVHMEIAFGLENVGTSEDHIKRKIWEVLQFLNITDLAYRDINTLSGGEKQKVAIASAVAYMPKCIILDEPTSQLDPAASEEIMNIARKINQELGITLIVIEQKLGNWFECSDKIAVLKSGSLAYYKDKSELYKSSDEYVLNFMPAYVKLLKKLGAEKAPGNFKEAREILKSYKSRINRNEQVNRIDNIKLQLRNLSCRYENNEVLKDLSLSIYEQDFLGIIGANGAGKSTLLKAMVGLVKYSGSIKHSDIGEIKKNKLRETVRHIGYVSQNPNDYISKDTVYEELLFTLKNFGYRDEGIIEETLKSLDIYNLKDTNPRDTSGGERQRIAIASILVLKPRLLILDEPTRGLHSEAKKRLGQTLKKLNSEGVTIIMVTHDIEFAAQFCNRFALVFDGQIVSEGSTEEVLGDGIYYTTTINKLLRHIDNRIFTLEQAISGELIYEKS
jgi:energy-coupling factor transport system ATP-binding protein